jgi:bacteriorhodopsin
LNIWDPFHPLAYFLHTILGIAGILGAILALAATKGSKPHKLAGRTFAVAATIAAITAIVFSFTTFAPMSIASAMITMSAIGSAFLALRGKSALVAAGELATAILMGLVLLWLLYGVVLSLPQGGLSWIPPMLLAIFAGALLVNDIRFMKQNDAVRRTKRLPRHMSRMAFAFAIAVHEPFVIFSDYLNIHPGLAYYGPFIIWPAIVITFNGRTRKNLLPAG